MHDHDALFRSIFAEPRHAASLLRGLLPADITRFAAWETLQLVPGTFIDPSLRHRQSDLLFTLPVAGQTMLIYLLLEHKSAVDRWTSFQVLQYVVRIHEAFRRERPDASHLPPVIPLVVHHGPRGWHAPRDLIDLIDLAPFPAAVRKALRPLQPAQTFLLDDLAVAPEPHLRARGMTPTATLALLALQFVRQDPTADPVEIVERWLPLWRAVHQDAGGRFGLLALWSYLARQLETEPERFVQATIRIHETETMGKTLYERAIEEGRVKGKAEGKAEGMAEGKAEGTAEGRAELLLRMLGRRFGAVPPEVERRIRAASVTSLDGWADRLLDVKSLGELLG